MTPAEIAARRRAQGWTQADLAFLVGVTTKAVGHWEADRRTPRPSHARALHAAFGLLEWAAVRHCRTCALVPATTGKTECGACRMRRLRAQWRQAG